MIERVEGELLLETEPHEDGFNLFPSRPAKRFLLSS